MPTGPSLVRSAHGNAAEGGALLVVECPPLDEVRPPNAAQTEQALALALPAERPFVLGNMAASARGPAAERIPTDDEVHPDPKEERRRVRRAATSLKNARFLELEVQYCFRRPSIVVEQSDGTKKTQPGAKVPGQKLSSGVKVELKSWALDNCWADHYDRAGDPAKASNLREKASGHQLKAIAIAEREAAARPRAPVDAMAHIRRLATSEPSK
jgi:hypothetical protein